MHETFHRHLGKILTGAALAAAGTAAAVAVTLPGTAGAQETGGAAGGTRGALSAGQDRNAAPPGVVEGAPSEGKQGTGGDPLTEDETRRVARIAAGGQLSATGQDVDGGRGAQRLSVDLAEPEADEADDPDAPRRADVTFYDYRNDTLVTRTVNLRTGKVEHTGTQHGVQPPPSRAENTEAARILIAAPLGAGLKADYKDATGKALTSPDQLELSGGIYRAAPGAQPAVLDACGAHRCVRLFSKVRNGPWIDTRDLVIDLSTGKTAALDRG
ncbi:Tat pathway signal sequence domain protein [Streptomyces sp. LP11]|uniref:Tat pathway signal sequence domain protein n=1 Tax=Streptomyces pyxinicus TaxID=2970331 RepID=A0ABT2B168_9ACTN|nr:Tat pathway signal sequence domain protein [Streptomyces sp. LP11]MCS0602146.1 Tat pathway signal sequence domain protein [Streptomyces sp. LP11]